MEDEGKETKSDRSSDIRCSVCNKVLPVVVIGGRSVIPTHYSEDEWSKKCPGSGSIE